MLRVNQKNERTFIFWAAVQIDLYPNKEQLLIKKMTKQSVGRQPLSATRLLEKT